VWAMLGVPFAPGDFWIRARGTRCGAPHRLDGTAWAEFLPTRLKAAGAVVLGEGTPETPFDRAAGLPLPDAAPAGRARDLRRKARPARPPRVELLRANEPDPSLNAPPATP